MNSYELSRKFFDWCFENPEKINTNHIALYFFAIEHCNRLGWKEKFGLPTEMVKDAIGIKSYRTYSATLNDLIEFGFIKMVERSKNQYSSNIIALSKFTKATAKALDKARSKQGQSKGESKATIDKPLNQETIEHNNIVPSFIEFLEYAQLKKPNVDPNLLKQKYESWSFNNWTTGKGEKIINWKNTLNNTLPYIDTIKRQNPKG